MGNRKGKSTDLELIRGSGNVFRDFGCANADQMQAKAILPAKILALRDEQIRKAYGLPKQERVRRRIPRTVENCHRYLDQLAQLIEQAQRVNSTFPW
jgi:hypothetical protein